MSLNFFKDRDVVPSWAADRLTIALSQGLIAGGAADRIRPQASVSRAEAGVLLMRVLNAIRP